MSTREHLPDRSRSSAGGFSLLEVLVAVAVLAIALLSLTALRTSSLVTAAEARNIRFARALAYQVLTEIRAGTIRAYDIRGQEQTREELPDFRFKILVGETEIQNEESVIAETQAYAADANEADQRRWERQRWLNDRSTAQRARNQGVTVSELDTEELEVDDTPDEDTFEEVAVYVYYPSFRTPEGEPGVYRLRCRTSTLALSGLTAEQAEDKQTELTSEPTGSQQADR